MPLSGIAGAELLHTEVHRPPGLVVTGRTFAIPLDHRSADGPQIEVFAREVADADAGERPYLLYLEGGPGFEAPRPTRRPSSPPWLERALQDFRVLLLDQRGTGRSSPIGAPVDPDPAAQAEYLSHFRADSIVRDAEAIRLALGAEPWSVLGQSFGGLCVTSYLSTAPEGLREAFIAGGLPTLRWGIDEVYARTYARTLARNYSYFERYPEDRDRLLSLHARVSTGEVRLPSGERLTWPRVRMLGALLGMSSGAERLHHIVELPHESRAFLHDLERAVEFARNPIYALLHEPCWADGTAPRWSAERMLPPEYQAAPELLTGEHVYPWMFDQFDSLIPHREAAHLLAAREWPRLYDPEALAANRVPTAAVIYAEDMYVEREFSEQTASEIGSMRTWLTNEYQHNGLRADGDRILGRLIDLARGRV